MSDETSQPLATTEGGAGPDVPKAARPESTEMAPDETELLDYALLRQRVGFVVRAPLRHKIVAFSCVVLPVLLAVAALAVLPKTYQASGVLLAQGDSVMSTLSNPYLVRPPERGAPVRAARETVLRRDNLVALLHQTGFIEKHVQRRSPAVRLRDWVRVHVLLMKERDREELVEGLVEALRDRLRVDVGPEGTVTIIFQWTDPGLAYDIVEAALQNFIEGRHAQEMAMVGEAIAILETQAVGLKRMIDEEIEGPQDRQQPAPSTARPTHTSGAISNPAVENEEVLRLRTALATRHRALYDLEEFRRRRIEELQSQLAQQGAIYSEQHPAILTLRQSIETLSSPSPQALALRREIADAERGLVNLGAPLLDPAQAGVVTALPWAGDDTRVAEDRSPTAEYRRTRLRQLLQQYGVAAERLAAARVEMDTVRAAIKYRYTIVSPPKIPKNPLKPKPSLAIAAALLGGLALAVTTSVLLDVRSGRVIEAWRIERAHGLPVLAELRK